MSGCRCYDNLKVSMDLKWEKGKLAISAVSLGIFDFFLQKCLLNSPPVSHDFYQNGLI